MSGTVGITLGIYLQPFKDGLKNAETMSAASLKKINQDARNAANEQSKIFKELGASVGSEDAYKKIAELQKQITEGARGSTTAIARMQTAGLTAAGSKAVSIHRETVKNMNSGFSFEEATQKAHADFAKLNDSVSRSARGIQNSVNGIQFDPFKATLYDVRNAVLAAFSIDKLSEFIDTGIKFESVRASLKSMTGSVENAGRAFEFLKQNSKDTGANVLNSARDFRLLVGASEGTGFSMGQLKDTFSAVSTAAAVLGLRADDTSGIMRAMGQIMSKGTVQSEELKGQIGDRLPGALGLAAKAMGKTNAELLKMMENGELVSSEFIPKFTKALKEQYEKGLTDAQKTTLYAMQNMTSSWQLFQDRFVNDTGINTAVGNLARTFTDFLNSMDTDALADFSTSLSFVGEQITTVNDVVTDFASSLSSLAGIKADASITALIIALGEGYLAFKLVRGAIALVSTEMAILGNVSIATFVRGLFAGTTAVGGLTAATATFGTVLRAAVPWLTAITVAVGLGVWAYNSLTDSIEESRKKMSSLPEQMKKIEKTFNDVELGKMFNKLTDDITASKIALGELQQKITDINTENKGGMFGGRTLWNVLTNSDYEDKAAFTKQAKELEKKAKDLETLKKKIQDQAIKNAKAREDEYKKNKDGGKEPPKTDPKAGKKENAQQAIDKLVVSLTSETLNGWDKTISEINEKVTKWTQTIDDAEKLLGKQAVARARSLVTEAKNALMVNAEQAYQANKDTFKYDFADEYAKAIQAIATKYSTFKKSLKEGEGGEAQTWVDRATAQADFNQKLKESNRVFSERENRINAIENEADKERELAQLAQDKINKEIELRNQYNQTNDKVIEVLTSQKELQKAVSNQAIANRERDNSLELLSYRETRNAKEAYQRESYAKELQLAINAGYTKEQAEFIALEKSKSTWDTYVDDISYSYSNMMDGLQEISKNAFSGMEDAFVSYMKTGKWSSKEFVDAIISDLMRMTVQMTITANLAKALGMGSKAIGDWWNSSAPTDAEFAAADASFTPKAKGGAYVGGVEKFAKGGTFSNSIVSKPTLFKFAKGTGMMGEAGAEAIMPLTRDSSGKLGVSASGAGGGVQNVKVEVINQSGTQVQANDVKISQSEQNGMIISIIVDDIRRGGAVAQAIRS